MKQITNNVPNGVMIFTDFMSYEEAENIIDEIEYAIELEEIVWDIPISHSPDITCFRGNSGFNISEFTFNKPESNDKLRAIDSLIGMHMLVALKRYSDKYDIGFTQDEGFIILKQSDSHVEEIGIDDNPFVNRVLSMHMPINVEKAIQYIKFDKFDKAITITGPSIILFPSNFMYSYSKKKNDGLYEIQNYFNNNPDNKVFDAIFGNQSE